MGKLDWGGGAGGAASGAAVGSLFGPVGTGVGAVAGGLLGLFGRKKKKKPKKYSTLNPMQEEMFNEYASGLKTGEGPYGDLFNFNPDQMRDVFKKMYADPAYQQYQEEVVPGITGQFRGGNLQNSSYLGGALAKEGSNVQKNLDAQLANMLYQGQQDSLARRMNGLNTILGTQTFAYGKPQESSGNQMFNQLLQAGGDIAGKYAANKFGGGGF